MKKLLTAILILATLAACDRGQDCRQAARLGEEIGRLGLPMDANRPEVKKRCRADFEAAWEVGNNRYCDPAGAFALGHSDAVYYGVCRQAAFQDTYRLGRTLWVLEVERQAVEDQLALLDSGEREALTENERGRLALRARELDREITDLRTIARIRGLLPRS